MWQVGGVVMAFSMSLAVLSSMSSSAMSVTLRVSVSQLCSRSNKLANLLNVAKCAGWAQQQGSAMLFLPENFGFMGESGEQTALQAEPPFTTSIPPLSTSTLGPHQNSSEKPPPMNSAQVRSLLQETVAWHASNNALEPHATGNTVDHDSYDAEEKIDLLDGLKTIAQASGLWISGGGMHVRGAPPASPSLEDTSSSSSSPSKPRVYNTHVIVDHQGQLRSYYRKVHLFDVSIPQKNIHLRESATTAPGSELVVCDSPVGKLGLSTCYDVRFPEMYIELMNMGAEILLVPSAFTVPTGTAHWHTLLRARAIENQCYVIAAAQWGRHNVKRESYGHSLVVDPWGVVLADAGGVDGPGTQDATSSLSTPSIITCDIDLDQVQSVRQRIPIQKHRQSAEFGK